MNADFVNAPTTAADFAGNLRAARVTVAAQLGLPVRAGTAAEFAALTVAERVQLTDELSYFATLNPGLFSDGQMTIFRRRVESRSFRAPLAADGSLFEMSAEFAAAYAETVGDVATGAADIAGRGLKALGINLQTLAIVAAVVAIVWFGAPYVIPKLRGVARP